MTDRPIGKPLLSNSTSALCQALEKRFMFDAAAAATIEKSFDLSHGVDQQEQQEVLAALAANQHVTATQSLLDAIGDTTEQTHLDYSSIQEVVFIDSRIQDPQKLIASISRNAAVEIINANEDGVTQITNLLAKYNNLVAIDIISHGEQGEVFLGNTVLSSGTLSQYASQLATWSHSLVSDGDVLFYGCNVGEGTVGANFIQSLGAITSLNIAASTDATGSSSLGGDWILESSHNVDHDSIIKDLSYNYLLSPDEAPTLSGTGLNPVFFETPGNSVLLFQDVESSTVDTGQTFVQFTVIIDFANASDQMTIDGTTFNIDSVVSSPVTTTNGLIVNGVHTSADRWDLQVTVPNYTAAQLDNVLDALYFKPVTPISLQETTRVIVVNSLTDSGSSTPPNSNFDFFVLRSDVTPFESIPTFTVTALEPTYFDNGDPVHFYANSNITLTGAQRVTGGTFIVTNASPDDIFNFDGADFQLTNGNHINMPNGGDITVTVVNGTATLTFRNANADADHMNAFINSATFRTVSNNLIVTYRTLLITELVYNNSYSVSLNMSSLMTVARRSHEISDDKLALDGSQTTGLIKVSNEGDKIDKTTLSDKDLAHLLSLSSHDIVTAYHNATDPNQKAAIIEELLAGLRSNSGHTAEIANSLYEIAVSVTKQSNTTVLLEKVVDSIVTNGPQTKEAVDKFLGKLGNDVRLDIDQRVSVVNNLISQGKQEEAKLLLKKLDEAPDSTLRLDTEKDRLNIKPEEKDEAGNNKKGDPKAANCTP